MPFLSFWSQLAYQSSSIAPDRYYRNSIKIFEHFWNLIQNYGQRVRQMSQYACCLRCINGFDMFIPFMKCISGISKTPVNPLIFPTILKVFRKLLKLYIWNCHSFYIVANNYVLVNMRCSRYSRYPLYKYRSTLIPAWMSNHMSSNMWD